MQGPYNHRLENLLASYPPEPPDEDCDAENDRLNQEADDWYNDRYCGGDE